MMHTERDLALDVAPIIRGAGRLLLSYYQKQLHRHEKEGDQGFVTEADLASERYLIDALKIVVPQADFFAEESGKSGSSHDYCWVIDPLDGTTNFAHGLPYFCISVALTYQNQPVFGMIYQPLLDQLWHGQLGKGAYLNGIPVVAKSVAFEKSIIAIGLPYIKKEAYASVLENTWSIARQVYAIRHFGAVALDIANVASSRLDGVVFANLGWWDVAAGMVLVTESGGSVSDFQGQPVGPDYKTFIAAGDPEVYQKLLNIMKPRTA